MFSRKLITPFTVKVVQKCPLLVIVSTQLFEVFACDIPALLDFIRKRRAFVVREYLAPTSKCFLYITTILLFRWLLRQ